MDRADPTVEAERAAANQILLCIVSSAGRQERVSGYILKIAHARRGGSEAVIHGSQQHRQRCAAGMADPSDSRRIDFRTRQQKIQTANGVPKLKARDGVAQQQVLHSRERVFGIYFLEAAMLPRVIEIGYAFALPHRIESQDYEAELCQPLTAALIAGISLARPVVAALKENRGVRPVAAGRKVQIGGDEKTRPRFVDEFFDAKSGLRQLPRDLRIERRSSRVARQ